MTSTMESCDCDNDSKDVVGVVESSKNGCCCNAVPTKRTRSVFVGKPAQHPTWAITLGMENNCISIMMVDDDDDEGLTVVGDSSL